MPAEPVPVVQAGAPPMSEASRLIGVFFEPKKTFADIAQRPRWLVPVLIGIVFGLVYLYFFNTRIGWEPYMHRIMDNNARMLQLPPDQRQRIFDMQLRFTPIFAYVAVLVFVPLTFAVGGAIALGIIKGLMGVPIRFKQAVAAFAYASLPRAIYSVLSAVVVLLNKNPDSLDPQNPFFSNPAALMDPQTSSKFLYAVASNVDIFVIWVILLTATGLKAAGGKRLSFGGALFAVVLPFVVFTLIRGALASLQ
ncbi:MAG: YIP1 family protein [Acidobacteriia bacterium]|nr:YIP1 family protein [Terriglobia bacterium]